MAKDGQLGPVEPVLDMRYGMPVYEHNPSVPTAGAITKKRPTTIRNGEKVMLVGQETGAIVGEGHAAFIEMREVDQAQFVKVYLAGIKQTQNLTNAGYKVFELVYNRMRDTPQSDSILLTHHDAQRYDVKMSERTFRRGLRELLEQEFLYRSRVRDMYWVNVNYMFNGNRITLAKMYQLKGKQKALK